MDLSKRLDLDADLLSSVLGILEGKKKTMPSSKDNTEDDTEEKMDGESESTCESVFVVYAVDRNGKEYVSEEFSTKEQVDNMAYKMRKNSSFRVIETFELTEDMLNEVVPLLALAAPMAARALAPVAARALSPLVTRGLAAVRAARTARSTRQGANDNAPRPANTNTPGGRPSNDNVPNVDVTVSAARPATATAPSAPASRGTVPSTTPATTPSTTPATPGVAPRAVPRTAPETSPVARTAAAAGTAAGLARVLPTPSAPPSAPPTSEPPASTTPPASTRPTPPVPASTAAPTRRAAAAASGDSADRLNAISLGQTVAARGGEPSAEATPRSSEERAAATNIKNRRREIANEETLFELRKKKDKSNLNKVSKKNQNPQIVLNPSTDPRVTVESNCLDEAGTASATHTGKIKSSKRITKALQDIMQKGEAKDYHFEDGTTVRIEPSMARLALQKYNSLSDFEKAKAASTMRKSYKDYLSMIKGS